MISVHIRKGFKLNISGEPSTSLEELTKPDKVALLPEKIPFIKPRLKVQVGDHVKIGTPLIEDKRNPAVTFLSPGSGRIAEISFGPRRVIREISVVLDPDEGYETFPSFNATQLDQMARQDLVKTLQTGGLWPLLRELPFRDIATPDFTPPAIIVDLDATEPFQPAAAVYLKGNIDLFEFGLKILQKLSSTVLISTAADNAFVRQHLNGYLTHIYYGTYPANDPGVLLYYIKKSPDENRAWYLNGQDVLLLASLLQTGRYPIARTIALGGHLVNNQTHLLTRTGVPLDHIARGRADMSEATRSIVGGIFRGYTGSQDSYLGFYETALTLLSEGAAEEFLGFARPGFDKPSRSRLFLSAFNPALMPMDCNRHGEERACINCGYCIQVCPVDILPQFTYKSILAEEIEEALAHGMLDCVECGLCTYVCPSKIELADTLKNTKKAYYLEQV